MTQVGTSPYFPVNVKLTDRLLLVIGGGKSAYAEVRRLLEFGARVDLVAPHAVTELQDLVLTHGQRLNIHRRKFELDDEDRIMARKYLLVFACSGDTDQNEYVTRICNDAGVLVCLPDDPEMAGDAGFVVPAMRKRGHIKISVGSDGLCPSLARVLLERIESSLGSRIDKYVVFLERLREKMKRVHDGARAHDDEQSRQIYRRISDSEEIVLAFQRENFEEATQLVDAIIAEVSEPAALSN